MMFWSIILFNFLVPTMMTASLKSSGGTGQIWAVLVSGAKHFWNYSLQANVCHAYQILHRHGIPDSNIIVMMYDDIAYDPENPRQGVIINKPDGPNLYPGVLKDYTKDEVTPENFINVLTGNKKAMEGRGSGKVLESGPEDHVFVFYTDHGAPGVIAFPDSRLYADHLIQALKTMHQKNMYKKLVFYLEACESGSMFSGSLPSNISIFATTASNPTHVAYATYCGVPEYKGVCLAGEYSAAWMEDIDHEDHVREGLRTETLSEQFKKVFQRMKHSKPCEYGDMRLGKDHVKDFLGWTNTTNYMAEETTILHPKDSISMREIVPEMLVRRINAAQTAEEKNKLEYERFSLMKGRGAIDKLFGRILSQATKYVEDDQKALENTHQPLSLEMMPCYRTLVDNFSQNCVNINKNPYTLTHLYKLANLCVLKYPASDILLAFSAGCGDPHRSLALVMKIKELFQLFSKLSSHTMNE